jgi:hypothetical protein
MQQLVEQLEMEESLAKHSARDWFKLSLILLVGLQLAATHVIGQCLGTEQLVRTRLQLAPALRQSSEGRIYFNNSPSPFLELTRE